MKFKTWFVLKPVGGWEGGGGENHTLGDVE